MKAVHTSLTAKIHDRGYMVTAPYPARFTLVVGVAGKGGFYYAPILREELEESLSRAILGLREQLQEWIKGGVLNDYPP